jgi:hypothetical protein
MRPILEHRTDEILRNSLFVKPLYTNWLLNPRSKDDTAMKRMPYDYLAETYTAPSWEAVLIAARRLCKQLALARS